VGWHGCGRIFTPLTAENGGTARSVRPWAKSGWTRLGGSAGTSAIDAQESKLEDAKGQEAKRRDSEPLCNPLGSTLHLPAYSMARAIVQQIRASFSDGDGWPIRRRDGNSILPLIVGDGPHRGSNKRKRQAVWVAKDRRARA
jgi:hypothetical protein